MPFLAPDGLQSSTSQFSVTTPWRRPRCAGGRRCSKSWRSDPRRRLSFCGIDRRRRSHDYQRNRLALGCDYPAHPLAAHESVADLPARLFQVTIEDASNDVSDASAVPRQQDNVGSQLAVNSLTRHFFGGSTFPACYFPLLRSHPLHRPFRRVGRNLATGLFGSADFIEFRSWCQFTANAGNVSRCCRTSIPSPQPKGRG